MELPRIKEHRIVLIDSFSGTNTVDVTGRFDHVISSEIDIEREFNIQIEDEKDDADLEIVGFQLDSEANYEMVAKLAFLHRELNVKRNACMRQTDKLFFKPKACSYRKVCSI